MDTKYPILLPRDHYLTKLIVLGAHEKVYHNKVKDTLNELRSKFWIVRGRQLVKKVIHRCFLCKKLEGETIFIAAASRLTKFPCNRISTFFKNWIGYGWTYLL